MNAAEFAWWMVTGQPLPPRQIPPLPYTEIGYPTAAEADFHWTRCGLCREKVLEHETIYLWCETLMQRAHLCMGCAEESEEQNNRLAQLEDYADALARQEER